MADAIQRVGVEYVSIGADKAVTDANRLTTAQEALAHTEQQVSVVREQVSKSTLSLERDINRYSLRLDPLAKALADVSRGEQLVKAARAESSLNLEAVVRAHANAEARLKTLTDATNDNAKSMSLNRTQMMMFQSAVSNTASSLGSGASAMQVLMQQGPDLVQALGMGQGGVGGTLKGIRDALAGIFTPARVAAGALAGVGIAAAMSFARAHEAQVELSNSMLGIGRGTGMTMGELNAVAASGAAASGGYLSLGQARSATATIAGTGAVDRSLIGGMVGSVERFAILSKQEVPDAAKSLASALSDPSKGALDLNKSLGFLNDNLLQTIKNLQASGDMAGAQKALFDAFKASIDGAAATIDKNRGAFSRLWAGITNTVSNADSWLGDKMSGSSAQDQIGTLRRDLDMAKQGLFSNSVRSRVLAENPGRIAELERSLEAERTKAEAGAKEVADNRLSLSAGATIRKYAPEGQGLQDLINARDELRKFGSTTPEATTALQRLNTAIATFETPLQRVATDSALAVRQTEAYTFAQKSAVAEEKARLDALRSSKDSLVAAAEAEKARNQLIAEGNAKAAQMARDARDASTLIGLSPYERARQQILNESKNFREQYLPTGGGAAAVPSAGAGVPFFASRAINGANASGLNPEFAQRLASAVSAAEAATGTRASFTSLYRDSREQADLYARYLAGGGLAAPPGRSRHERGTAADIPRGPILDWLHKNAGQFGLEFLKGPAFARDPVHIQMAGSVTGSPSVATIGASMGGNEASATKQRLSDLVRSTLIEPFNAANQSLADMERGTKVLNETFGKSREEIFAANEAEKLYTQYIHVFGTKAKLSADALKEMNDNIEQTRVRALAAAKADEEAADRRQRVSDMYDITRSSAGDLMSSPLKALMRGQNAGQAMQEAAMRSMEKMLDFSMNSIMNSLFGKQGQPGGMFGGGIFDFFKGLAFADGGVMSSSGPIPLRRYAGGGVANSPQMAIFGEGSMNEAYVPLPDGRRIPVAMQGGGGGAANVTVNHQIINNAGPDVKVETKATRQSNGNVQMQTILHQALANDLASNGPTARLLQNAYGLNRATGRTA